MDENSLAARPPQRPRAILVLAAIAALPVAFDRAAAAATDVIDEAPALSPADPAQPRALGRVFAAGPSGPSLFVLTSMGYGYTEAVLDRGDAHHRAMSSLTIDGRPLSWLGFALRFDGRYDWHRVPGQPNDDGAIGDTRFWARADTRLGSALRAGARLGVWLAGGDAPSLGLNAASPELSGTLTYAAPRRPLWLTANLGYRLDRSARSASYAPRLSDSDRLALEVSAFDQVLVGLGGTFGGPALQGFVEASGDLLTGDGHPPLSQSPMRIGGGARVALGAAIRLEAAAEVATSSRPALMPTAPLVPVPPRVAVWFGLAYQFESRSRAQLAAASTSEPLSPPATTPVTPAPPTEAPPPVTVTLRGQVTTADASLPGDARLFVERDGQRSSVPLDADGRFALTEKPGLSIAVRAEAPGYDAASQTLTVPAEDAPELTLRLERHVPRGQIRGLVRSLAGVGLDAEIRIEPPGRSVTADQGRFEVDVSPGAYQITIEVRGYQTQRRRVQVEPDGVTLLNIDLTGKR